MANKKKVLIIGGSGFIGKSLGPYLIARDCEVTLLNRGNKKLENTHQLIADRNVESAMKAASEQAGDFDAIIDTCAYTLVQSQLAWEYFGQKSLKWIHISSAAVYTSSESNAPHAEDEAIGGAEIWAAYGRDKSAIDSFLLTKDQAIILRPPYIYGPNNDVDRETFVWSRAEAGMPIIIPEKDDTSMQFLHVVDLADCIYTCLNHTFHGPAVLNVAGDEIISIKDWVALLLDICSRKKKPEVIRNKQKGYEIRNYFPFRDSPVWVATSKIQKELHWQAKYTLREGFTQTYANYGAGDLTKYLKNISSAEKEIASAYHNHLS